MGYRMLSELNNLIPAFIQKQNTTIDDFNNLALLLFKYQFNCNLPYQQFCRSNFKTPRNITHWTEIPPISINAFKEFTLSCVDVLKCEKLFMTSGTTRQDMRGKHYHPNLDIYDLSMKSFFKKSFMMDHERLPMGILFPNENELPNSSLAHYLSLAVENFGTNNSAYLMSQSGLEVDKFLEFIKSANEDGKPIALLGASYSYILLFQVLKEKNLGTKFPLPKNSLVLDTGGFKGQVEEIELTEFYSILSTNFQIPLANCINMYGMTELSTQFYDIGQDSSPSIKKSPHWIKTRVLDPLTLKECRPGEKGLLVHCDLANINSVSTILTEDIGLSVSDGFLLLGREKGVQARGCSITVENIAQNQNA